MQAAPPSPAAAAAGAGAVGAAGVGGLAGASWVQPYHSDALAALVMPLLGDAGAALCVLAGLGAAIVPWWVLRKRPPWLVTAHLSGLTPERELLAAAALWALLLLAACLAAASAGGGDGGFGGAAAVLAGARPTVSRLGSLATGLDASGGDLLRAFGRISGECPPQVHAVLGGSIEEAASYARAFAGNASLYAGMVQPLPASLDVLQAATARQGVRASALFGLAVVATLLGCGAVAAAAADVHFLGGKMQHFLGAYAGSAFEGQGLAVAGGLAAAVAALSAAAALSLGGRVGALCRDLDGQALRFVGEELGFNSSTYGLSRYYILGLGENPVSAALGGAAAAAGSARGWVTTYQWAIHQSCPQWDANRILSDLSSAGTDLGRAEGLLRPEAVYPWYTDAARDAVCGSLPGLGWLVVLQLLLALLSLPALTLFGIQFLRSRAEENGCKPSYSRLQQDDLEAGEEHAGDDHDLDFNPAYYIVFGFSVVCFVVGAFMYFLPSLSILRRITGTLLYACGIFLLTNSDLIVTYVRMRFQMEKFQGNNRKFGESLDKQACELQKLRNLKTGLDELNNRFGDDASRALKEVNINSDIVLEHIKMCCKKLLRLYSDRGGDRLLTDPDELKESFELFRTVFAGLFRADYGDREKAVRYGLELRPGAKDKTPVTEQLFSDLFSTILVHEPNCDLKDLKTKAKQVVKDHRRGDRSPRRDRYGAGSPASSPSPSPGLGSRTASPARGARFPRV